MVVGGVSKGGRDRVKESEGREQKGEIAERGGREREGEKRRDETIGKRKRKESAEGEVKRGSRRGGRGDGKGRRLAWNIRVGVRRTGLWRQSEADQEVSPGHSDYRHNPPL